MLKVNKDGRVRAINEQDLDNHKSMGWSLVEEARKATNKTKTKTKSVEVKKAFEEELDKATDDLTPTEEN